MKKPIIELKLNVRLELPLSKEDFNNLTYKEAKLLALKQLTKKNVIKYNDIISLEQTYF